MHPSVCKQIFGEFECVYTLTFLRFLYKNVVIYKRIRVYTILNSRSFCQLCITCLYLVYACIVKMQQGSNSHQKSQRYIIFSQNHHRTLYDSIIFHCSTPRIWGFPIWQILKNSNRIILKFFQKILNNMIDTTPTPHTRENMKKLNPTQKSGLIFILIWNKNRYFQKAIFSFLLFCLKATKHRAHNTKHTRTS